MSEKLGNLATKEGVEPDLSLFLVWSRSWPAEKYARTSLARGTGSFPRACLRTLLRCRVRGGGLQEMTGISSLCRPDPLTGCVLKQALRTVWTPQLKMSATAQEVVNVEVKVVEAAGIEPASPAKLPAATTCLVRREFQPLDNLLTRIQPPSQHEFVSGCRALTPRPPQPAMAFIHRSRRPVVNVATR